jgi:hypothetical protein
VAYLLGLGTRLAQVLALLCLVSLDQRNLFLADGGVVSTLLLLSFTLFLPLGERYSLDALIRRWRRLPHPTEDLPRLSDGPRRIESVLMLGVLIQLAAIYFFNTVHKSGDTWWNGEAVHWDIWQNRVVTPLAVWLRQHEPSWLSPLATRGTLLVEGLMPVLLLSPFARSLTRRVGFLLGVGLHLSIALLMTLGPFSFAMIGFWFLLLPVSDFLWVARLVVSRETSSVELDFDPSHSGARWLARMVATLVSDGRVGFTCNISGVSGGAGRPLEDGLRPSSSVGQPGVPGASCSTCNISGPCSVSHGVGGLRCFTCNIAALPVADAQAPPSIEASGCCTWNIDGDPPRSLPECFTCNPAELGSGSSPENPTSTAIRPSTESLEEVARQGGSLTERPVPQGGQVGTYPVGGSFADLSEPGSVAGDNRQGGLAPPLPFRARTPDGDWVEGKMALSLVLRPVPVVGSLLAGAAGGFLGEALLTWARSQPRRGAPIAPRKPRAPGRISLISREIFGAMLLLAILLQMSVDNSAVPSWLRLPPPEPLASLIAYPRLLQGWRMFSPDAPQDDGILVVDALTADGRHIDPFTEQPPNFEGASRGPVLQGAPLCDYLFEIHFEHNEPFRQELGRFLDGWHTHGNRRAQDHLVSYEVWWVNHASPAPGSVDTSRLERSLVLKKSP